MGGIIVSDIDRSQYHLVYGGNSSVLINGVPYAGDANACIRRIYLRSDGIQEPIDFRAKVTFAIGNAIEDVYGDYLASLGHTVEKSVRVKVRDYEDMNERPCEMWDETDMIVDSVPYEIKSISSSSMWEQVFLKQTPKWDNVVQAFHHLVMHKSYVGMLVYIATIYHKKTFQKENVKVAAGDMQFFKLKFDKATGIAMVDGKKYPFRAKELITWRKWALASQAFKDWNAPTPRYYGDLDLGNDKFKKDDVNPVCQWCCFKKECEESSSYEEFKNKCQNKINNA